MLGIILQMLIRHKNLADYVKNKKMKEKLTIIQDQSKAVPLLEKK